MLKMTYFLFRLNHNGLAWFVFLDVCLCVKKYRKDKVPL